MDIPERGSSAHRQLETYHAAMGQGLEPREALYRVVDWLIDETVRDL